MRYVVIKVVALGLAISLSACSGGGGGGTPVESGPGSADAMRSAAEVALPLPSGNGLVAGEIRVAPGGSKEHGNVVVSCPAGGSACIVTVAADGTATYDSTGGVPTVTALRYSRDYSRDNPSAEDLLDHWNDPQTLRTAMELSAVSRSDIADRKNHLKALLDGADGDPKDTGVTFRNVRLEDIEIIGEKNGTTYGQWKGGPAGTLNIEFDLRFIPEFDTTAMRASLERHGKLWSWRLRDDFDEFTVEQGTQVKTNRLDEDVPVDDLLIFVVEGECNSHNAFACAGPRNSKSTEVDFEPSWGVVIYNHGNLPEVARRQRHGPTGVLLGMTHELGHVLGIGTAGGASLQRYINDRAHTFEGPESVKANSGKPVPFQFTLDGVAVPPHAPGATPDYGHLGVCDSVMVYSTYTCYSERQGRYVPNDAYNMEFQELSSPGCK